MRKELSRNKTDASIAIFYYTVLNSQWLSPGMYTVYARNSRCVANMKVNFARSIASANAAVSEIWRNSMRFALIAFTSLVPNGNRTDERMDERKRSAFDPLRVPIDFNIPLRLCPADLISTSNSLSFIARTSRHRTFFPRKTVPRYRERILHFAAIHQKRFAFSLIYFTWKWEFFVESFRIESFKVVGTLKFFKATMKVLIKI